MSTNMSRSLILVSRTLAFTYFAAGCSNGASSGGSGGSGTLTGGQGNAVTSGGMSGGGATQVGGTAAVGGAGSSAGAANVGGNGTGSGGAQAGGAGVGGGGVGGSDTTGGGGSAAGGGSSSPDITVQLGDVRQLIRGFGINNNWAAISSDADKLFGNGAGQLGLNILRVGMGPDGEPYNGSSCYSDINAVVKRGEDRAEPTYIMATLWSPPANCKSNNSISDGGYLLESCYDSWSTTIANFADKIEQNTDTTLYAMSPQNEADFASCGRKEPCNGNYDTTTMTGAQAVAFQKIVGPKLRAKKVKPMSPEASEWIHVWSNKSASGSVPSGLGSSDPLKCGFPTGEENCKKGAPFTDGYEYGYALHSDADAWAAFDIMGTHQYDTQVAEPWPSDVPRGDKEVWQTEMSGVKWWPEQGTLTKATDDGRNGGYNITPTTHIENGVAVARWVHSGLVVGEANAWLYWWYKAIDTDDNEGLVTKSGQTAKRFYTFGQFTKFIRPNYHRVNMTGVVPDKFLISAYKGDDGTVVVVAINETTEAKTLPITIGGGTAPAMLTPYLTSATADIVAQTPVAVAAGKFDAALPAMSVTTFVGK